MFDNLKNFIRHGKHANDMKPKDLLASDTNRADIIFEGSLTGASSNLPSDLDASDESAGSNDSEERVTRQLSQEQKNSEGFVVLPSQKKLHKVPKAAPLQMDNFDVASRMVEQERRRKRRQQKYPNLHDYEVLERLGEGAFSVVYKARHIPTGKFVAIKILRKYQMDEAQKQAVFKEVIIMRQLKHPGIVDYYDFIESEPYYYIVQDLINGGEIFGAIVNYTYLSEDLSRHVIYQVALAVRHLHEEVGIVHRDIKPENLLFVPIEYTPSLDPISKLRKSDDPRSKKDEGEFIPGVGGGCIGQVKLADFGLSKQIWENNTKTPCGTVGYTAPEIVRDERYSKEVDMWALGCVLYTMLCGFPPFYDEKIETLTEKVARGEYTFLSPWWDEISVGAKYCVSRLLTVDPAQRYTIDDLLNDPWMRKAEESFSAPKRVPKRNPNRTIDPSKYGRKMYGTELYSPAANALRDAFDMSAAVHRANEEAALKQTTAIPDVVEEDEEMDFDPTTMIPKQVHQKDINPSSLFNLDLGGASIIGRRKNKVVC